MSSIFRILKSNIKEVSQSSSQPNLLTINKLASGSPNPFVFNPQTETQAKSQSKSKSKNKIAKKPSVQESSSTQVQQKESTKLVEPTKPTQLDLEKKIYWEYGNSGLKTKEFGKKQSKNLGILQNIDKVFLCYSDLKFNSLEKLFNPSAKSECKFGDNIICSDPEIPGVLVKLDPDEFGLEAGTYQVLGTSFTTISNIKIEEKHLSKNRIPEFDNFIGRLDNLKEIFKIIGILSIKDKFKIRSNSSSEEFSFESVLSGYKNLFETFKSDGNEKKLLKSNSDYAFYVKIYESESKGFVIDGQNGLIYYVVSNENFKTGTIFLRYYCMKISSSFKIKKYIR